MCRSSNLAMTIKSKGLCLICAAPLMALLISVDFMDGRYLRLYAKMALSSGDYNESVGKISSSHHEENCKLLTEHVKHGRWIHQFVFPITDLIQIDPRLQKSAMLLTSESLNGLSAQQIYLNEEMKWLHGSKLPPFPLWSFDLANSDECRGMSYLSSIGNQCGCRAAVFQPSHSKWVLNKANISTANESTSKANSQHSDAAFSESPSMKLARRFARKNQTVCFAGDSIEYQFYTALRNNLHRSELLHQEHLNKSVVNITTHQYPLHYVTNATSYGRTERYRMPDDFWMFATEVWETIVTFTDNPSEGFQFRWFKHYMWAPWLYEHMESCDVIIMNHALHYHWQSGIAELYNDTTAAVMYLANFTANSENRVAIWRSTLPQHFDTPNGQYPLDGVIDGKKCVAIKEDYISQEDNTEQEYTKVHNQVFSDLCSTDDSICGDSQLTCTVKTNAADIFSVYSYWVANNLTAELDHAQKMNPTHPNVTGTILRWELFDLFNVPMWHAQDEDCSHYCYVPALYEAAFYRLDLLLSLA